MLKSDGESSAFKNYQSQSNKLRALNPVFKGYADKRKKLVEQLLDMTKETQLLVEIKDIVDEINIILNILQIQQAVLNDNKLNEVDLTDHGGRPNMHHDNARHIVVSNIMDFNRIHHQATQVRKSVCCTMPVTISKTDVLYSSIP